MSKKGILEIFKIKKKKPKRKVYILYQTENANLPSGIEAERVRILGYRCGKEDICPIDGKVHQGQKLHIKHLRKKCVGCSYLEIILERFEF